MPVNQHRRQQKLAKQKAKRKEYERRQAVRRNEGVAGEFRRAAAGPVLDSIFFWSDQGAHIALLSRNSPSGIAVASFMVDSYCLGVKDALHRVVSNSEYKELLRKFSKDGLTPDAAPPSHIVKFVKDAVAYARSLGFAPHNDYAIAQSIFGDISASECTEEFEFGKDGKPYFISGPFDSFERCQEVLATLRRTVGEDRFNFVTHSLSREEIRQFLEEDGEFEDFEEDDDDDWEDDEVVEGKWTHKSI